MFGGPIYTDKKLFGNFPTPLFMPKSTKTSRPATKNLSRKLFRTLSPKTNYHLVLKIWLFPLPGPLLFTSNLKFTKLTTRAALLFLLAVALPNWFPVTLTKSWHRLLKPYYVHKRYQPRASNFSWFQLRQRKQIHFHYGYHVFIHCHSNNEGLQALKHFFDQRTTKEPSTQTLLRLAELVLTLNCFSFSGNFYKQINGVAMGTKWDQVMPISS